ncbi:MAG: hypothetical protein WB853_13240, partial [Desulfobacterales bacterium]
GHVTSVFRNLGARRATLGYINDKPEDGFSPKPTQLQTREKSVTEHGPGRAEVAGVAAKAGAGDDAEALQAEGPGHLGHQTVQLQSSGVRILF